MKGNKGALSGCRTLDLTDEKGGFCIRLLADMGAEVINSGRAGGQELDITLDLEVEQGRAKLKELLKAADVLVESYPPGYLEKLGLGYAYLSGLNPRLIVASITNFGQNGPYRDYKSDEIVASALGGQMYVSGEPGMPPLKPFGKQTHNTASLFAVTGIMLALWHRHTTGRGQQIDISLQDCVAATLDHVLVRYLYEGEVAGRQGNRYWNGAFRLFPCRDGTILLSLNQQWETLVEWLATEDMAEDLSEARWRDAEERLQQREHIVVVLERWTRCHTVAELVEKGQLMHFPWAEVATVSGLVNNPQLKVRDFFMEMKDADTGKKYKYPRTPLKPGLAR
ncbi:CaiB/BaiF CoA transferase family protein [Chloroflexota bacterium]